MNKKFLAFWALCSIILLDGIGMGIIFPLLVPLFWDTHLSVLPAGATEHARSLWYGITMSVFPLGMFFSAPIMGDLSDGYGRRKVLRIAVCGVGVSYLLSAVAIILHSLALLIFSRLLAGLLSACLPIAQAAAMDLSTGDEKAKNLSLIFLFTSIGFVVGPVLGGSLSNSHWISWFGLSTPMFVAAIFSFLCCYVLKNFQETLTESRAVELRLLRGLYVLKEVWQEKPIRLLLIVMLFYQLGWSGFFQIAPAFAAKEYGISAAQIGYYSSLMGVGFGIAFLGSIAYLEKRFKSTSVVWVCFAIGSLCFLAVVVWRQMFSAWLTAIPLGFCMATIYTLLTTIGSNKVAPSYQGWFMGATMSVLALAWFASPLINSFLFNLSVFLPIEFSLCSMLLGFIMFIYYLRR